MAASAAWSFPACLATMGAVPGGTAFAGAAAFGVDVMSSPRAYGSPAAASVCAGRYPFFRGRTEVSAPPPSHGWEPHPVRHRERGAQTRAWGDFGLVLLLQVGGVVEAPDDPPDA